MDHQAKCHPPQICLLSLSLWHTHTLSYSRAGKVSRWFLNRNKDTLGSVPPQGLVPGPQGGLPWLWEPRLSEREPSSEGSGVCCWLPLP